MRRKLEVDVFSMLDLAALGGIGYGIYRINHWGLLVYICLLALIVSLRFGGRTR